MISGTRTTEIAASLEDVFAVAADIEHYPEWQDFLQRVIVLERDAAGRAAVVRAEADAKVMSLGMELRCTIDPSRRVAWRSQSGDLKAFDGAFELAGSGPDRTRATFTLDVDPGRKLGFLLGGGVGDRLRDRILDGMLGGLRTRAERGA